MKRLLLIMAFCLPLMGLPVAGVEPIPADTIITLDKKRIEVKDNGDRMKVRVYELTEEGDSIDDEMVFEGHYRDGQSYERRKHIRTLSIPVPTWDRDFSAHWAGIGLGFNSFIGDDLTLRKGNSWELNLNFMEFSLPFSRYNWAVVTGAGLRWNRYRLDTNGYLKEIDGVTVLVPAPEDMVYKKSRLNITSITIPVLLEWQTKKVRHRPRFFVSAGVVGVVKTMSSSKVTYRDERDKSRTEKMDGGMNIHPVTMDLLFQVGTGCMGAYFKYSPIELFENNRGPAVNPISFGLHLHI